MSIKREEVHIGPYWSHAEAARRALQAGKQFYAIRDQPHFDVYRADDMGCRAICKVGHLVKEAEVNA